MKTFWPPAVEPVAMSAQEGHLYAVPLDTVGHRWAALWTLLSPDERQRTDQFRFEVPRRCFVIARAALRTLLSRYLDLPPASVVLAVGANGKPRLGDEYNESELRFNLAHTASLALIFLTRGCEVGVDVERLRTVRHAQHIAQRYFHPAEIEAIRLASPAARDAAFMRCWTGKEAILKAIGVGIIGSLAAFQVPMNLDEAYVEVPANGGATPARCWLQRIAPADEYLAAVACVGAQREIRCFEFHG
jgi:4'-phosphopantetheinyl transferase